jgi:hypothetical protein
LFLVVLAIAAAVTAPMFGGQPFGLSHGGHMELRVIQEERTEEAPATETVQPDATN